MTIKRRFDGIYVVRGKTTLMSIYKKKGKIKIAKYADCLKGNCIVDAAIRRAEIEL